MPSPKLVNQVHHLLLLELRILFLKSDGLHDVPGLIESYFAKSFKGGLKTRCCGRHKQRLGLTIGCEVRCQVVIKTISQTDRLANLSVDLKMIDDNRVLIQSKLEGGLCCLG